MDKFSEQERGLLRNCELLKGVSDKNFETFISLSNRATYNTGEALLKEGQNSDYLYILISGEVELYKSNQHLIGKLGKGQSIGEMRIIRNQPCSLTVKAKTPMVVLSILISKLRELEYYQCYESILDAIINVLTVRLIATNKLVEQKDNSSLKNKSIQMFPLLFAATAILFVTELALGMYYFM